MTSRKLTKRQLAIIAYCRAGHTIRRRGAYGGSHAAPDDPRFASSITIDQLLRDGWLKPAEGFGEYEYDGRGSRGR